MKFHVKHVSKKLSLTKEAASVVTEMATKMGRLPDGIIRGPESTGGQQISCYWWSKTWDIEAVVSKFCPH